MKHVPRIATILLATAVAMAYGRPALAQEPDSVADTLHADTAHAHGAPPETTRHAHAEGMRARGDRVMGFSARKTAHHFRLLPDGGAIEVTVRNPADTLSRNQIRRHLAHIAHQFAQGDFEAPMLVHGRTPAGVPAMKRMGAQIRYTYEPWTTGARIRIVTRDPKARAAVHEFLRFQIREHHTGDPTFIGIPSR